MALVVESWAKVKAIDGYVDVAGELLFRRYVRNVGDSPLIVRFSRLLSYYRIFEINPDASTFFAFTDGYETGDEAMYKTEIFKKHANGVILAVTAAVSLLETNSMEKLVEVLKNLGAKHATLALEAAHYELVGTALMDTLEKALGDDFTPEVKQAWAGVYGIITEKMMEGAKEMME
jgi:hemoglobin-like flavoprotein